MRPDRLVPVLVLALAGCLADTEVGTELTREAARRVVDAEVSRRLPGIDASPVTDCVIDNASGSELLTLAAAAATRDGAGATDTVGAILRRPETLRCVAAEAPRLLTAL